MYIVYTYYVISIRFFIQFLDIKIGTIYRGNLMS